MDSLQSKLRGKRALITAGAQGIGLAISRQLAAAGCDVFAHYHSSEDSAKELCEAIRAQGLRAACAGGDLTRAEDCDRLVETAAAFLGGIDVLVNNAGSLVARKQLGEGSEEFWAEVMSLNLGSCRMMTRAAIGHLKAAGAKRGGASIVNLSSLAGRMGGGAGAVAYATAKGAMLALTRGLASELGPGGIRVNSVAPGLILRSAFHETHTPADVQKKIIAGIPLGRAGVTEDVARAVVYLASEFDGFITGTTLDINGGVYYA